MIAVQPSPRDDVTCAFPLRLNTTRYRDQWHTMTRTGLSPKLSQHRREALVEVHPDTVQRMGLEDGGLARVTTPAGSSIFRVLSTDNQRRMDISVPIHWTDQTSAEARTGLLPTQSRDPHSGQPGFKNTPASIAPVKTDWAGFLITREAPATPDCLYWTRVRTAHGTLTELAGVDDPALLLKLLPQGDMAEVRDAKRGIIRAAVIEAGALVAVLFITRDADSLPPRDWLVAQLGGEAASVNELLAGRLATPLPDRGAIICVCFDIGLNTIIGATKEQNLTSIEGIGAALKAGTNCGSCRPALAKLLETGAA